MEVKRTSHSVYNLNYHIVLVPKYRHKVFVDGIDDFVKERIREICNDYGWDILALEVMSDHCHVFVSAPPRIAPLTVASTLKSILAVDVFREYPLLKQSKFWGKWLVQ